MALEISGVNRKFQFDSGGHTVVLDDINPRASVEEIKRLYCDQYPELVSATISGPQMDKDCVLYKFSPKVGTKG